MPTAGKKSSTGEGSSHKPVGIKAFFARASATVPLLAPAAKKTRIEEPISSDGVAVPVTEAFPSAAGSPIASPMASLDTASPAQPALVKAERKNAPKPAFFCHPATAKASSSTSSALQAEMACETSTRNLQPPVADSEAAAHAAIDLAKVGKWKDLMLFLDAHPHVVNLRPAIRDFGILHQTAFHGNAQVVETLVTKYGANPDQLNKSGKTPLQVASGDARAILRTMSGLANFDQEHQLAQSVFEQGVADTIPAATTEAKQPLAASNAAPASETGTFESHPSSSDNDEPASAEKLEQLAHSAIDFAKADDWDEVVAVLTTHPEVVNLRPSVRDFGILHQATYFGSPEVVSRLLNDFGADPNRLTKHGKFALDIAHEEGNTEVVEILSKVTTEKKSEIAGPKKVKKKKIASFAASVTTPLAKKFKSKEDVSAGTSPSPCEPSTIGSGHNSGLTAVSASASVPSQVSDAPHNLAELEKFAHAAIDLAKDANWKELVAFLDDHREIVDVRPSVREYGLIHQAAYHGCPEVVATLVEEYGADPARPSQKGMTALDISRQQGHDAVEAILLKILSSKSPVGVVLKTPEKTPKPKNLNVTPLPEFTSENIGATHKLLDFAKDGHWSSVFKGLDENIELVNVRPHVRAFGILHQAAYIGDVGAAKTLIHTYGADPALLSKGGKYPEEVAQGGGHKDLADFLSQCRAKLNGISQEPVDEEGAGDEFQMVQQPDGSWKVVQV